MRPASDGRGVGEGGDGSTGNGSTGIAVRLDYHAGVSTVCSPPCLPGLTPCRHAPSVVMVRVMVVLVGLVMVV